MIENEDYGIDLLDLLKRLLGKWKLILLSCIVLAMLAGLVGAYRVYKDQSEKIKLIEECGFDYPYLTYNVASKAKALGNDSKKNVINAVEMYESYQSEIDYIKDSIDKSLLLKFSTDKIPTSEIRYYIKSNDGITDGESVNNTGYELSESDIQNIIKLYIAELSSEENLQRVIDDLNLDTDTAGLSEIVSFYADSDMLAIKALGDSKEMSDSVAAEYDTIIEELDLSIKDVLEFSVYKANQTFSYSDRGVVLTARNNKNDEITEITDKISENEKTLTSSELELYNEMIQVNSMVENSTEEEIADLYVSEESMLNLKLIVIGFIAGGMLFCAAFAIKYLADDKLHTNDELNDRFGIENLFDKDNVKSVISKNKYSNIIVLGAAKEDLQMESCSIDIAEYAIFAEKLDVTDIKDVMHNGSLCSQHNIQIIGYVVL